MKKYIILFLSIMAIYGCYKSDTVTSELGTNPIKLKPSEDKLDNLIYEFYQSSNSVILYNYNVVDYKWNWKRSFDTLIIQTNRDYLFNGVKYLNKIFGDLYTKEFKQKNFPPEIFLADSVNYKGIQKVLDEICLVGNKHLEIGRIRDGIDKLSNEDLLKAKGEINGYFWGKYMFNNKKIVIPESFFEVGKDKYSQNLLYTGVFPENAGKKFEDIEIRDYGFWSIDPKTSNDNYKMTPKKDVDVYQYISIITTTDYETLKPILDRFPKLKMKYTILVNYIRDKFNIDIQEIGNKKI